MGQKVLWQFNHPSGAYFDLAVYAVDEKEAREELAKSCAYSLSGPESNWRLVKQMTYSYNPNVFILNLK